MTAPGSVSRPLSVGLVGYGLAGRIFHRQLVASEPGMRVTAVVTANENRRQQAVNDLPEARLYDRYDDLLLDESVDLVVLGTPHDLHETQAIAACEAKKHVVVDKIMALGAASADRMIAAARRHDVVLSVFHNRRWDSDFLTVKQAIASGRLGEVYSVESSVARFGSPPAPDRPRPWRAQAAHGGGPFRDWGAHLMDQAVQLFGPRPELVFADFQYRWPGVDVETAAVCWMRFPNGVRYRVEVGAISHTPRPRWYIRGSRAALTIWGLDPQEDALKRGQVVAGAPAAAMPADAVRLEGPAAAEGPLPIVPGDYAAYYRNVAAAVRGDEPLIVHPEGVRDVLAATDAAIRSAAEGMAVRVGA